jgi:hypothetical protein
VEVVAVALGLTDVCAGEQGGACIMAAAFMPTKMFIQWRLEALSNVTLLLNNLLLSFHVCFSRLIV